MIRRPDSSEEHRVIFEETEEVEQLVRAGVRMILARLNTMENTLMSTIQELVNADAGLAAEVDVILTDVDAIVAAETAQTATIEDLKAQIAALGSGTITPEQQAQLDATVADLADQQAKIASAHDKIVAALPAPPVVAPTEPPAEPTP